MATATKKKKHFTGRNTALFYALMAQLPGYEQQYAELIKEGIINDFLTGMYGERHGREIRLSLLSDTEYSGLISNLQAQVNAGKNISRLQQEAARKHLVNQILRTLSRIGVTVVDGNWSEVNRHIRRLPISKGRIIPQFHFVELDNLLGAVRAYCDNILKQQREEKALAYQN